MSSLKVLIAEDELMIADMVEDILVEHGYEVCGIARNVDDAVALIRRHKPDLAILDLRLDNGGLGTEIVDQLGGLGTLGVLYASGNTSEIILTPTNGHACITKPYRDIDLVRGLQIVAGIVATGTASPPFPRGFRVLSSETTANQQAKYG